MWKLFDDAAAPDLRPLADFLAPFGSFPPEVAAALTSALASIDTQPQTITAADAAQGQLIDLLIAHGHRAAAFLDVYHGITVAVIEALERGVLTPEPFFVRLAAKFAERHFDGVLAELGLETRSTDASRFGLWRPSFAFDNLAPSASSPLAIKPAMAHFTVGMCCHINFDLAIALDETIRELGYANDREALVAIEAGHNFVDLILADAVERSTEVLAAKFDCPMSKTIIERKATKTIGEVSMATIRRWRAKTFTYALQLSSAPDEAARAAIRADLYRSGARKTVRLFNTLPSLIEGTLRGTWLGAR